VFGDTVGAGLSEATVCLTGMMGRLIVKGVVAGLAHCPVVVPAALTARALSPSFAMSMPVPVSRPILKRSRRLRPALMMSCRLRNA